jgi:hypothetical protein
LFFKRIEPKTIWLSNDTIKKKLMALNLFIEVILLLFTILAFNGIIYSFTLFKLNEKNSSENIPLITNSSEKVVLTPTLLLASSHLRLTSSESESSAFDSSSLP